MNPAYEVYTELLVTYALDHNAPDSDMLTAFLLSLIGIVDGESAC